MRRLWITYKKVPVSAKAALWYTVCNFLQKLVSIILVPLYVKIMSVEDYGIYSLFISWQLILINFAGLGLQYGSYNVAMVQFKDNRDEYTSSAQGLWWTCTTICFMIFLLFRKYVIGLTGLEFWVLCAVFLFFYAQGGFELWQARKRFDYGYKKLVLVTVLYTVLSSASGILGILLVEEKLYVAVWMRVIWMSVFGLLLAVFNLKKGKKLFSKECWKFSLGFNFPLLVYYLSGTVLNHSDRIMINHFCGVDKVAIYSAAYSFAMILNFMNQAISQSLVPWEYERLENGQLEDIKNIGNFTVIIVGVIHLCLIAFAPEIIEIFTTSDYVDAIWIIPPVVVSSFMIYVYGLFTSIEFYFLKKRYSVNAALFGAVMNIILNVIIIPYFGFLAAGFTTLFSYGSVAILHYLFLRKICREEKISMMYNIRFLLIFSILMMGAAGGLMFMYKYFWIRIMVVVFCLVCMFLLRKKILEFIKIFLQKKVTIQKPLTENDV